MCYDLELICNVSEVPYVGISTYGTIGYVDLAPHGQIYCKNTHTIVKSIQYNELYEDEHNYSFNAW